MKSPTIHKINPIEFIDLKPDKGHSTLRELSEYSFTRSVRFIYTLALQSHTWMTHKLDQNHLGHLKKCKRPGLMGPNCSLSCRDQFRTAGPGNMHFRQQPRNSDLETRVLHAFRTWGPCSSSCRKGCLLMAHRRASPQRRAAALKVTPYPEQPALLTSTQATLRSTRPQSKSTWHS